MKNPAPREENNVITVTTLSTKNPLTGTPNKNSASTLLGKGVILMKRIAGSHTVWSFLPKLETELQQLEPIKSHWVREHLTTLNTLTQMTVPMGHSASEKSLRVLTTTCRWR